MARKPVDMRPLHEIHGIRYAAFVFLDGNAPDDKLDISMLALTNYTRIERKTIFNKFEKMRMREHARHEKRMASIREQEDEAKRQLEDRERIIEKNAFDEWANRMKDKRNGS